LVDSLKTLDPERPIREADIHSRPSNAHAPMARDASRIANVRSRCGNTPEIARGTSTAGTNINRSTILVERRKDFRHDPPAERAIEHIVYGRRERHLQK